KRRKSDNPVDSIQATMTEKGQSPRRLGEEGHRPGSEEISWCQPGNTAAMRRVPGRNRIPGAAPEDPEYGASTLDQGAGSRISGLLSGWRDFPRPSADILLADHAIEHGDRQQRVDARGQHGDAGRFLLAVGIRLDQPQHALLVRPDDE